MKRKTERAILRVVIATGISSVVTQLLIIREFLSQFQSNEFVIALILFNWLVLGGVGTYFAHLLAKRLWKVSVNRLGWLSLILVFFSAVQIPTIRYFRNIFFIYGSSVGFYPTLTYIFFTIAPYCLILGFVLPYSLFVIRKGSPDYPGARIYITDNIGDVTGGALFSFALVYLVTPLQAVLIANIPLLLTTCLLVSYDLRRHIILFITAGFVFLVIACGIFTERLFLEPPEGKIVYYSESRYGRIEIHQNQEQYTLFVGGVPLFGNQNLVTAEETIHYPMSQTDQAKNILLISAQGGMLTELAKYKPESVDYVELDPQIAKVQFKFGLIKKIPGLHIVHQDGRAYLSESNKKYDVIIVNLGEPDTFQINRFFTDRFFALVKSHLAGRGVFSFAMKGFDNYLAEPQRQKLSSLYNTLKKQFSHVLLLPGQKIFFLGASYPLHSNIPALLSKKGIHTRYISAYYYGNLTEERIHRLNGLMDLKTPENRDDFPYLMQIMFKQWFARFSSSPRVFFAILTVLCIIYMVRISMEEFVLFSTGFTVMGSEILVIFAFQIFFGYIYLQIGLIITVFLAGLLPGAWLGDRFRNRSKQTLIFTDGLLIFLTGLLMLTIRFGGDQTPVIFFLAFGFAISMVCGFQFPIALYLKGGDAPAVTRTFSADLIGAAGGTLVTNVILIPYCGIFWSAASLMGIKLFSLFVMVVHRETS